VPRRPESVAVSDAPVSRLVPILGHRRHGVPTQELCAKRYEPSGSAALKCWENPISVRANRRSVWSIEKLSRRCPHSSVRCTTTCNNANRQQRPLLGDVFNLSGTPRHHPRLFQGGGLLRPAQQTKQCGFTKEIVLAINTYDSLAPARRQTGGLDPAVDHQVDTGGRLVLVINELALLMLHHLRTGQMG